MKKPAMLMCAIGAVLAVTAFAQEPELSKAAGPQHKKLPKAQAAPATPSPKLDGCCEGPAIAKNGAAHFKVYVAGKGYRFYASEKDAHSGRKAFSSQGIKVGPIQKVSLTFKAPKLAKA